MPIQISIRRARRRFFMGTFEDYKLLNLNYFTRLEELRIHFVGYVDREAKVNLNLPHLKVLNETHCSNLKFNSPKLEFLKC